MVTDEMVEKAIDKAVASLIDEHPMGHWRGDQVKEAARRAIAALSAAEPAAWVYAPDLAKGYGGFGKEKGSVLMSLDGEWINVDTPLYAAPPAPSVAVKGILAELDNVLVNDEQDRETLAKIRTMVSALSAQVQDVAGWQLVPVKMTAAMINAWSGGKTVSTDENAYHTTFQDAWARVLAAAPAKQEG